MASYRFASPLGTMEAREDQGFLVALDFVEGEVDNKPASHPVLAQAQQQVQEYFAGKRQVFDLPFRLDGTAFRKQAWEELLRIPYGKVITYGQLAQALGKPKGARAAGQAIHYNPLSILVPCHRVIGKSGALTGYGGGLWRKEAMLKLEQQHQPEE